jgi:hypothetical protein
MAVRAEKPSDSESITEAGDCTEEAAIHGGVKVDRQASYKFFHLIWHEDGNMVGFPPRSGSPSPTDGYVVDGLNAGIGNARRSCLMGETIYRALRLRDAGIGSGHGLDEDAASLFTAPLGVPAFPLPDRCAEFVRLKLKDRRLLLVDPALLCELIGLDGKHRGLVTDLLGLLEEGENRESGSDDGEQGEG